MKEKQKTYFVSMLNISFLNKSISTLNPLMHDIFRMGHDTMCYSVKAAFHVI